MSWKDARQARADVREVGMPASRTCAFLVRCWQTEDDAADSWRFSIQQVGVSAGRRAFARPADLVTYLVEVLDWTEP